MTQNNQLSQAPSRWAASALAALIGLATFSAGQAQDYVPPETATGDGLVFVETADGLRAYGTREIIRYTHSRMVFEKDLERVAVGNNDILEIEILNGRELLVLAKEIGRTSLIVWYPDQTTETFLFSVIQDLSVLERALRDIHPAIRLELAPDRAALVLRGSVPTIKVSRAAESTARHYLAAGSGQAVVMRDVVDEEDDFRVDPNAILSNTGSTVINLLQVQEIPLSTEEKIGEAIADIGGGDVTVRRVSRGDVEDDLDDTLILQGTVENQVALVRVLNIAARLFLGAGGSSSGIVEAIADESGALIEERDSRSSGSGGLNNLIGGLGGGQNNDLENEIRANVGRAKLISVAGGRILSMIEVRDLPQIRVAVQLHEVDRDRLRSWRPNLTGVTELYRPESFTPGGAGLVVQPDQNERIGSAGFRFENALQILGGALTNNFQIGNEDFAFDFLFSLLESEGISRTLSRPTLTVLAGEPAVFQVGGEVPIPSAFAPSGLSSGDQVGANTPGVFSGTEFRAFGVQLVVRPMVGDNDTITLDVRPTISLPDAGLTQSIAGSTGTALNTTAFNTRALETTARLRDGQPLVIGGLVSRNLTRDNSQTPVLAEIPYVGLAAQSKGQSDTDTELVIVVTPTIIREPLDGLNQWQYPDSYDLLTTAIGRPVTLSGQAVNQGNGQ